MDDFPPSIYVNGAFISASDGGTFPVIDPATEKVIGSVGDGKVADGFLALDAAADALPGWSATPPRERGEVLRRSFELMTERSETLAKLIVSENGKTFSDAKNEVAYAAEFFRWFSEEAVRIDGQMTVAPAGTNRIVTVRQPVGVSLLVTPWNFPAAMLTRKLGPALAAGCTTVCKPAAETPLTALMLAEILSEAGAPPGVVNVVPTSEPASLVSALLGDERVRKLSFTGSTEVGRGLLATASAHVVNCSMELGGNAPFIVFADADLDAAVAGAMLAKMRNGGQACTSANRFYIEEPIADEFTRRFGEAMAALKSGPGLEPGVDVGPLINSAAFEKVSRLVAAAIEEGASVLVGGTPTTSDGYFFPPTVLVGVKPKASILSVEIFGPVAPIVTFSREDEVINYANATEFGLVSYLYTGDLARGLRLAEAIEAGMVAINRGLVSDPAAPFGGVKQSGLGREGGHEGMHEYLETKYISCSW